MFCVILVQLVGVVVKTFGEAYLELVKHQDIIYHLATAVFADISACVLCFWCSLFFCSWWVWW
jgi:hypothetical protein